MAKAKEVAKKLVVKKTTKEEVPELVHVACTNCEDSGMSCSVCKNGRDDIATDVV